MARLKRGREERLRAGHLWVYRGELAGFSREAEPGSIVDLCDASGHFLGRGYYNPASQISLRLLTNREEPIDEAFFARRLAEAIAYRERVMPGARARRVVYSEADFLPGLVLDQYGDYLVLQILTLGMEKQRAIVLDICRMLAPLGIQERSEASSRRHEGLAPRIGPCMGEIPAEVAVKERGPAYLVNLGRGQKTGHFLDQHDNRLAAAAHARGRRVLDCFCHTGMFGIAAAVAGAAEVRGVDLDAAALALAERNAALNEVEERCAFCEANAFDYLRGAVQSGASYDMVILDPPAFTKSKGQIADALRGYKEINLRAMRLLAKGGILVTCSCSYHISPPLFQEVVAAAAADAGCRLRLLERRGQAQDHPVLLGMAETEYLKCLILEVLP